MRQRAWLGAALGLAALLAVPAGAARAAEPFDALRAEAAEARDAKTVARLTARLASEISGLPADAEPAALQAAADAYGALVTAARATNGAEAQLAGLLASGEAIGARVAQGRERLEDVAGEDEAALEALYGSRAWRRLDFVELLVSYWSAWARLSMAPRAPAGAERDALLRAAERDFARTRLELALPQATWSLLGLALVQRLRGDADAARVALEKLDGELAERGDPELLAAAILERAAIAFEEGDVETARGLLARMPEGSLSPEQRLDLDELEARAWLARARDGQGGAEQAADLLRRLDAAGGERARRAAALVAEHRELLAPYEIGATGSLLAAERAFEEKRFAEASAAYERALAHPERLAGADLVVVRFKLAVALSEAGAPPAQTLAVLEALLADEGAASVRSRAAALYYALASRDADAGGDAAAQARARRAARLLLAADPESPAADHARYRLATGGTASAAEREAWLAAVAPESDSYPSALLERVRLAAERLQARVGDAADPARDPDAETRALAEALLADLERVEALAAAGRLAPDPPRDASHAAWRARATALAGAPPEEVVARIDAAARMPALDRATGRSLLRLRLSTLARGGDFEALSAGLAAASDDALRADWDLWHEALGALEARSAPPAPGALLLAFHERLAPLAPPARRDDAELSLARALLREGRARDAAERAGHLVARDPTWADARWVQASALETFDPASASEAWTVLARGLEAGSEPWLDAQLARARSANDAGRPDEACRAAADVRSAREDAARDPLRARLRRAAGACAESAGPESVGTEP